ncbi:MAG: hypothetical protein RL042_1023 [Nitrospirota bacterium]|jgi:hypothetical protein
MSGTISRRAAVRLFPHLHLTPYPHRRFQSQRCGNSYFPILSSNKTSDDEHWALHEEALVLRD